VSSHNPSKAHHTGTEPQLQSLAVQLNMTVQAVVMLSLVLGLSSCGFNWIASRKENPVLQENIGSTSQHMLATISTTASHRTAYIRNRINPSNGISVISATEPLKDKIGVGRHGQICPEPPPDVGQAVASSLAAALTGNVTAAQGQALGNVGEATVGTALQQAFSTSITPLLRRSQGLQYHRDAIFYLCIAYINEFGGLGVTQNRNPGQDGDDAHDFWAAWNLIQKNALEIIKSENDHPSPTIFITINPNSSDTEASIEKVQKLVGDVLDKSQATKPSDEERKK
jgi:hypothetical protein